MQTVFAAIQTLKQIASKITIHAQMRFHLIHRNAVGQNIGFDFMPYRCQHCTGGIISKRTRFATTHQPFSLLPTLVRRCVPTGQRDVRIRNYTPLTPQPLFQTPANGKHWDTVENKKNSKQTHKVLWRCV